MICEYPTCKYKEPASILMRIKSRGDGEYIKVCARCAIEIYKKETGKR